MKANKISLFCYSALICASCSPASVPVVNGISIVTPPTKLEYNVGEIFDPTGVVIKEVLSDGKFGKEISDYTYTPTEALKLTDTEITFMYKDFTAKQEITVKTDINYVSSIEKFDDGRVYLMVEGKPFNIQGAQLRVDGLLNRSPRLPQAPAPLTFAQMEKYFVAAKNANLNCLELALQWSNIEPQKDKYDFSLVDALLSFANKYDLKCEFLWFASNMCGDSFSYQLPKYIYNNKVTYPRLASICDEGWYSDMYGECTYICVDNPAYQERETKAIHALMDHIYQWNKNNGEKNPLIGVQVHNETDGLVRWRRDQRNIKDTDGKIISYQKIWNMTLSGLNNAGKAFKDGKYKIYTRCNMTTSYDLNEFPQCPGTGISVVDVYNLEGIDIIGSDPYVTNPSTINQTIKNYRFQNNYPHLAENMGRYVNGAQLFLTAYQAGGSYMFYDLATPEYFMYIAGDPASMDQGLYKPDLSLREHTQEIIDIVKPISALTGFLPHIDSTNFAAFNVVGEGAKKDLKQTINTNHLSITYETSNGGVGFAIEDEEYAYLGSNKDGDSMIFNNAKTALYCEVGHFDKGVWVMDEKAYPTDKVYLSKGKVFRIKITKFLNEVTSTTNDNV